MKARILIPLIAIAAACAADLANAQLASHLLAERQKVAHPDGPSYQDGFGATVAMSNGMLACSAWDDTAGENAGAVFIFRQESSGGWTFSQKIVPQPIAGQSDAAQFIFGTTIAMEGDTLLIGASGFGTGFQRYGALYYYQRQGDNWIFGARIEGNANRRIGAQVALDGDTLVTAQVGGAFVYERIGGTWTYRAELSPNEEPGSSQYGNAVAIGGDTIVVTARARQSGGFFSAGGAFVFRKVNGNWIYHQTLVPSDLGVYTNDQFGNGAAVRGDTIAIGTGAINRFPGRVIHLFKRDAGGTWIEETILTPAMFPDDTGIRGDQQYFDIEISENERLIAAGIPDQHYGGNFESPGAVLFYEKIGGQWQGTARIGASDKSDFEDFGWSIALDGDTIAAGNPKEDVAGTANYDWFGAVYVFSADLSGAPEVEVDAYLRAQLYYEQALADACCSPGDAAFRWKTLLYEGSGSGLHAAPDKIGEYFGAAERQSAAAVRQQVADLLAGNPGSELFRDLLLDIDADLLASEAIAARANLVNIDRDRLLRVGVPPLDLILDDEIADYEAALPGMRAALAGYLDLWTDDLGAAGGGEPLGYTIFKERVPQRDLMPALYLDNGSLQPAGGSGSALQSGYRDATMLYERFADFGETAATLAHLYWLRNTPASLQAARDLIGETSRFLFVQGNTLRGTFPENPAQLQVPMASWNAALAALSKAEANLDGDLNPLGFEENFYVLFNVPQGGNSGLFDTFNILRERLDDTGSNANQIVRATDAQQEAIDAYEAYVGGQEEIEDRLSDLTRDAKLRLLAIVGAEYGTDAYNDSPGANVGEDGGFISGSELWQQFRNIRRAQIQIEKNGTEIQNLREAAAIEAERNLFETETQNAIGRIQIRYANQRADIQEQIGAWNAAQEYTNILKDAFNPANWGQVIGTAIAGGVAVGAELSKGELEAQRERIGGLEQAEIIGKENEILNANSAAKIKTMMLDMGVLVLNSQENAILLQQEIARLTALFRERAALERRIVQHEANLARRYFADPVHQLRYLNQFHIANQKFAEAQQTIYLAAKALEYKWNEPFAAIMAGTGYKLDTIFQVRNAGELQLIVDAMELADNNRDTPGNRPSEFTDVFSLRDDAFGFDGSPDGIAAFREFLRDRLSGDPASGGVSFVAINLEFSTVRDPLRGFDGDNFFRGPRLAYAQNGTASVLQKGNYLDKIKSLQITIPGAHTTGRTSVSGSLTYGGTGFIRRQQPGNYNGPRPDRVANELAAFPTRVASTEAGVWRSEDTLTATISAALGAAPAGSPIDIFRERSVAANGWDLTIVVKDGTVRLNIDEIDDIKLHFTHQLLTRQ